MKKKHSLLLIPLLITILLSVAFITGGWKHQKYIGNSYGGLTDDYFYLTDNVSSDSIIDLGMVEGEETLTVWTPKYEWGDFGYLSVSLYAIDSSKADVESVGCHFIIYQTNIDSSLFGADTSQTNAIYIHYGGNASYIHADTVFSYDLNDTILTWETGDVVEKKGRYFQGCFRPTVNNDNTSIYSGVVHKFNK